MAFCLICGEKLACNNDHPHDSTGSVVQPCPLKQAAIWVHVMDDVRAPVQELPVYVGKASQKTMRNGFAHFDPLDAVEHDVALPRKLPDEYDLPPVSTQKVKLRTDEIAYLAFEIPRKPELSVQVVEKGASSRLFGRATVNIGGRKRGHNAAKETDASGVAHFGKVPADCYDITVRLEASDTKEFSAGPSSFEAKTPGKKEVAVVEAVARPAARIEIASKVLVVQANATNKRHRIPVVLRALGQFDGVGQLQAPSLKFFETLDSPTELSLDSIPADRLSSGYRVYAQGERPSKSPGDAKLILTLKGGSIPPRKAACEEAVTCVRLELEVHRTTGEKLTREEKQGDGVVVAEQTEKKRRRAKVVLLAEPSAYEGTVLLSAVKDNITLFDSERGDGSIDLSAALEIGPSRSAELWLEGKTASAGKADTGLALKINGWSETIDAFKATVVKVELVSHEARGNGGKGDPIAIPADKKIVPGRTLFLQTDRFEMQRAKLRLIKSPPDAPCKVQLKVAAGNDKVKLYPGEFKFTSHKADGSGDQQMKGTLENHSTNANAPGPIPGKDVAADEIKDGSGLTFWVEGSGVSVDQGIMVQVDIEKVDLKCDAVSFTVARPTLEIEIGRTDGAVLAGDVDFKIVRMHDSVTVATDTLAKGTANPKKKIPVAPGHYRVVFEPKDAAEKTMRVNRLVPAGADAAVSVLAHAQAKFELAPPYKQIQFIGYWVNHAASKGIDATKTTYSDRLDEARRDMKEKAALMKDAIMNVSHRGQVHQDPPCQVDHAETVLKLFMAPEFYFRGQQGAYPMEVVSEILTELNDEITQPYYKDWLFVLGTAIGTIGLPEPVNDPMKKASATVAGGVDEGDGDDFHGMKSKQLQKIALWLTYNGATRPAKGWAMLTPAIASVTEIGTDVTSSSPTPDWIRLEWKRGGGVSLGDTVTFEDPVEVEIANVAIVRKGGDGMSTGADGRGLNQLLIEKEYVAWADLPTPVDESQGMFFADQRQLVTIYGQTCRAKPPEGSYMPRMFAWSNKPPVNQSEINTSGSGGGSVFTIDKITFGLEVCMDHGYGSRLQRYYTGRDPGAPKAKPGEPRLQVQLIPAGGMKIKEANVCTVSEGLVFNVDVSGCNAKMGVTRIDPTKTIVLKKEDLTKDPSQHFETSGSPGNGQIKVYPPLDVPEPDLVK